MPRKKRKESRGMSATAMPTAGSYEAVLAHFKNVEEIAAKAQDLGFIEGFEDAADDIFSELEDLDRVLDAALAERLRR